MTQPHHPRHRWGRLPRIDAGRGPARRRTQGPRARLARGRRRQLAPPLSGAGTVSSSCVAMSAIPAVRTSALESVDAVVHLAAIVGDPACERDPERAPAVNLEATRARFSSEPRRRSRRASSSPRPAATTGRWRTAAATPRRTGSFARSRSTPRRRSLPSSMSSHASDGPARDDVSSLRDGLRPVAAHALRSHRQRVHAGRVREWRARGLRRAVLATVRPRPRRGAGDRNRARGADRDGRRGGLQRRRYRARTTGSKTWSSSSMERLPEIRVERVAQADDPRDYRVSFEKITSPARLRDEQDRP